LQSSVPLKPPNVAWITQMEISYVVGHHGAPHCAPVIPQFLKWTVVGVDRRSRVNEYKITRGRSAHDLPLVIVQPLCEIG